VTAESHSALVVARGRGVEVDTEAQVRGAQMALGHDEESLHGPARCLARRAGSSAQHREVARNRGAIGDGGRHRKRTRRWDGAWRSDVGAQGPVAWGGALGMARAAPVA
jgi:hypothetical protein